mmetsp:Transcript_17463/g.17554  ORF Transcript_17463/g.17554 Transcript_17463/m.17554 type:complete len:185 (-) Transcript_17463:37-591(-)
MAAAIADNRDEIDTTNSMFLNVKSRVKVALEPRHTARPLKAIQDQLHTLLFIYDESIQGIPICFSDVKFRRSKPYGRIMAEMPWVHVDVEATIIVFKIKVGQRITGRAIKVSDHNVSFLVCGIFNASISKKELQKNHYFDVNSYSWQSETHEQLVEGGYYEFEVRSYQHINGVFFIEGKIPSLS